MNSKKKRPLKRKTPPAAAGKSGIRNRIIDVRKVKASELRANPENWRHHPESQRSALRAMLEDVGVVDALIARDTPAGLELVDGHLRSELAGDDDVHVVVVDLDDVEVRKVLATFDPLSGMAVADPHALANLLDGVDLNEDNADIRKLLADLRVKLGKEEDSEEDEDAKRIVAGMPLEPHEHYDYLVVLCTTAQEWNVLCDRLGLMPVQRRRGRMGTARAIKASQLLEQMPAK